MFERSEKHSGLGHTHWEVMLIVCWEWSSILFLKEFFFSISLIKKSNYEPGRKEFLPLSAKSNVETWHLWLIVKGFIEKFPLQSMSILVWMLQFFPTRFSRLRSTLPQLFTLSFQRLYFYLSQGLDYRKSCVFRHKFLMKLDHEPSHEWPLVSSNRKAYRVSASGDLTISDNFAPIFLSFPKPK